MVLNFFAGRRYGQCSISLLARSSSWSLSSAQDSCSRVLFSCLEGRGTAQPCRGERCDPAPIQTQGKGGIAQRQSSYVGKGAWPGPKPPVAGKVAWPSLDLAGGGGVVAQPQPSAWGLGFEVWEFGRGEGGWQCHYSPAVKFRGLWKTPQTGYNGHRDFVLWAGG